MSATLQEAVSSLELIKVKRKSKKSIADKWLGKFKGAIPENESTTKYIKNMRRSLYGKV